MITVAAASAYSIGVGSDLDAVDVETDRAGDAMGWTDREDETPPLLVKDVLDIERGKGLVEGGCTD